ncbi:tetratricopeptide repeat protein [Neorhodopirellula pilleata]|uniref:Tetratricopeptide repeat protein n=1 Tax=Neorhodopirellula pilleata TaxID=2714738 RepID=A0A5C5ZGV0_9BACT|nr:hypothetical protein [Neorhodopirellula pilleata]TWT86350.1 hypothetical protein Pla100_61360 [Neorhodopirellula pilleata]
MANSRFLTPWVVLLTISCWVGIASAQTDRLYPTSGDVEIGKIKAISKDGIVMTIGGKDKNFPVGEIRRVSFQGDPPELTRARDFIMDAQYDQALSELKQIDVSKLGRDEMKADTQFYLALSQGEMALSGQGDLAQATAAAMSFVQQNPNSYHFYSTTRLLGDLAKAIGNFQRAAQFYGYMLRSPSADMKVESVYQGAMVKLAAKDTAGAKADLEKVLGIKAATAETQRFQTLAKAALAVVAAQEGQVDQAIEMVNGLIKTMNPTDTQTNAKIYNALGAAYLAAGKDEDALLAYLHTQLMYSMHAESHVEALKQLVELWTKVGKPDRAAQARGELQQRYPGLSG